MSTFQAQFRFRRNDNIGTADAEADEEFLSECFLETGDLEVLRDYRSPKRIIVGRTGTGKSALLRRLAAVEENTIELQPEVLSLNYLTNSTILKFFENLGVRLDPFYSLLWRHVFTVELIRKRFHIQNEQSKLQFLGWLSNILERDKAKKKALAYLEEWGSHFWEETEYRIREYTTKLESDLTASAKASGLGGELGVGAADKLTVEQKDEIVQRAQYVVSGVQIKDLHEVMRLLREDIFDDPQQRFFVLIDRLDENWVDDPIRYKLLRALLEAVRAFQEVPYVKIVVALRLDLLDRVFRTTRDAGFQEEKYESLFLRLRWTEHQLESLLDKRIDKLVKRQYTKTAVKTRDLLPNKRRRDDPLTYMLQRTFLRPREAILFVNECLSNAEGKAQITWNVLTSAEVEYSRKRLRSLADEWHSDFPSLIAYTRVLTSRKPHFPFKALDKASIDQFVLKAIDESLDPADPLWNMLQDYTTSDRIGWEAIAIHLVRSLYQTGVLGLRPRPGMAVQWSFANQPSIAVAQLAPESELNVHPTFWSVLGISNHLSH